MDAFFFFGWLVQVYTTVKVGDDSLQFVQTNTRFVQVGPMPTSKCSSLQMRLIE